MGTASRYRTEVRVLHDLWSLLGEFNLPYSVDVLPQGRITTVEADTSVLYIEVRVHKDEKNVTAIFTFTAPPSTHTIEATVPAFTPTLREILTALRR